MEYILHLIIILLFAYLAGPSLFNWYTEEMVLSLDPLIIFTLALIAFFIGSRLQVGELKKWSARPLRALSSRRS